MHAHWCSVSIYSFFLFLASPYFRKEQVMTPVESLGALAAPWRMRKPDAIQDPRWARLETLLHPPYVIFQHTLFCLPKACTVKSQKSIRKHNMAIQTIGKTTIIEQLVISWLLGSRIWAWQISVRAANQYKSSAPQCPTPVPQPADLRPGWHWYGLLYNDKKKGFG